MGELSRPVLKEFAQVVCVVLFQFNVVWGNPSKLGAPPTDTEMKGLQLPMKPSCEAFRSTGGRVVGAARELGRLGVKLIALLTAFAEELARKAALAPHLLSADGEFARHAVKTAPV
jgi:hypothetical protein